MDMEINYLWRGFETAKRFAENHQGGLLLLFGDEKDIRKVTSTMDGELAKQFISQYGNPLLYNDKVLELYEEMTRHDGAVAFDRDGNLIDTDLMIQRVDKEEIPLTTLLKIKLHKNSEGTRHISAAYASTRGLDSIVVSEEVGTVLTFSGGYVIEDLQYIPEGPGANIQETIAGIKKKCRKGIQDLRIIFEKRRYF